MNNPAIHPVKADCLPRLSSQTQGWEHLTVQQFQTPGEGDCHYKSDDHTVCLSLASRPVQMIHMRGGRT